VEDRADVAVFATVPFAAPVTLCGAGEVVLAVRLSVAGAAFPGFAVNPGTGAAALDFTAEAERTVTIGIATGGGSWLELPVLPA
jgi:predicted acyl esterase